jgi:5S rRNA maturation endonuclease (ribonuclease M5)
MSMRRQLMRRRPPTLNAFSNRKMKKTKINAIIVVEGVTDVAFLTSFIDAELVSTNGSDVPVSTIAYFERAK